MAKHSIREGLKAYQVDDAERISPQFLVEWKQLLEQSNSLYCQYSGPEWIEAAAEAGFSSYAMVAVRESTGSLSGLLIWRERGITLRAGPQRMGLWVDRPALCVEGDVLLKRPSDPDVLHALITMFPPDRIIQIKSIAADHPAWEALRNAKSLSPHHLRWTTKPAQPLLFHVLSPSAGGFEASLSARRRRHLRQGVRALSKAAGAPLSLDRIALPEQVDQFRSDAADIIQKSWQRRMPIANAYSALQNGMFLKRLAEMGILRAYVLRVGGQSCAFVLGYQYRGIFHYSDVAYDEELAHASPGILLLQYLMQDLTSWNPPKLVNFGIGDALYKRLFSNSQTDSTTICFLPKTLGNFLLVALGTMSDALRHTRQEKNQQTAGAVSAKHGKDNRAETQNSAIRE